MNHVKDKILFQKMFATCFEKKNELIVGYDDVTIKAQLFVNLKRKKNTLLEHNN